VIASSNPMTKDATPPVIHIRTFLERAGGPAASGSPIIFVRSAASKLRIRIGLLGAVAGSVHSPVSGVLI
jgi:hypothetical protein